MNIDELTIGEAKQLACLFGKEHAEPKGKCCHPMLGKRCLVRTYSAGVHIGDVVYVDKALKNPSIFARIFNKP